MALSVEDLTRRSDLVVLGEVVSVEAQWASDHRHVYRRVVVRSDECWKGNPQREVEVVVPGGEVDGVGEKVLGEPELTQGMRGVFFLEPAGKGHRVIGLSQGFFFSAPEGLVQRTEDLALVHQTPNGYQISEHGAAAAPPLSIAALHDRVAHALSAPSAAAP
jgi:hypothetical protein